MTRTPKLSREVQARLRRSVLRARVSSRERYCPWIVAILATEDVFRPWTRRFVEYLAWAILSVIWPARARLLSVGLAQVQVRHWAGLGKMHSVWPTPANMLTAWSRNENYDVAEAYVRSRLGSAPWTAREIAKHYVGEARAWHVAVLQFCYDAQQRE